MGRHEKDGKVVSLPNEWPKRFILPQWATRPEYACAIRNDKKGTVGRFDYLSYLVGVGWSSVLAVHNLKFRFQVYHFRWVGMDWRFCSQSKSYSRLLELSYPVRVQCFDTGSVLVSVKCTARPFPLDMDGLLGLSNLLGQVKHALHASCIPEPMDWQVVHWHLNRDSEKLTGGGLDVNLTFRDFFGDAAQFYYKQPLNVVRAEVSQNPKLSLQEVFEKIIDRDNFAGGKRQDA
jgi:hypothetical protein